MFFFREIENATTDLTELDREDFHQKNATEPIEITITFSDLSVEAQNDFSHYYRQEKLIVSAVATFSEETGKAEVRQYGQRLAMPDFKTFFSAVGDNARISGLRDLYLGIRNTISDLPPPGTKEAMISALHQYETQHPERCQLTPSLDQFYGVSRGANILAKYIQWIFVPAVKDAATEQVEAKDTALGKLLARTVRAKTNFEEAVNHLRSEMQNQYQKLLEKNQHVLKEISHSLKARLTEWAHPEATLKLEWRQDPKSVRVEEPLASIIAGKGDFEGELARFWHGLQRSYLLALLHELASSDDTSAPRLILGCEEPELYQHPPQARHLSAVLHNLSKANSQIIVATHSPLFISGEGFEDVRIVRKDTQNKQSKVMHMKYTDIVKAISSATGEEPIKPTGMLAKIHQALQPTLNEMFFATRLILVEGLEDVAYITTYLNLLNKWDEYRRIGCHIVPVNRKSEMLKPLVIAKHMCIPTFIVFDADSDEQNPVRRAQHAKDNKALLTLVGKATEDPMPTANLWGRGFVMWHSNISALTKEEMGSTDSNSQYGHAGNLGKNGLHISASLVMAWNEGKRLLSLERLCGEILDPTNSVL